MNLRHFIAILLLNNLNQYSASQAPTQQAVGNPQNTSCEHCRSYAELFMKEMTRTSKDEENTNRKTSEDRFVEIQETICSEMAACYVFTDLTKEWFLNDEFIDLFGYLCVRGMEVCCSDRQQYGPNCQQCPDCSTNGECVGAGERNGNGSCLCAAGYAGEYCDRCDQRYYPAYKDSEKLLCAKCHDSCADSCTGAGSGTCLRCQTGYRKTDEGCIDINECLYDKPCSANKFCVNKEGTYTCLKCDPACQECTGDGPDMCVDCANGYLRYNAICVDSVTLFRDIYVVFTRYITYLGMCIATFIIFQKNVYIASVIGIAVALYISASEIMLTTTVIPQNHLLHHLIN